MSAYNQAIRTSPELGQKSNSKSKHLPTLENSLSIIGVVDHASLPYYSVGAVN